MERRMFIKAAGAGALALPATSILTRAQDAAVSDVDPVVDWGYTSQLADDDYGKLIAPGVADSARFTGGQRSNHRDVRDAFRIMFSAPRDKSAYEVAQYFLNLSGDDARFRKEFKTVANPLIVGFFSATQMVPSGDETAWCAAFLNFCLLAAGKDGTASPLSGSFRKYGENVDSPREGDIAVFWANGARGDKGFGHVAFYQSHSGKKVRVLGGNQSDMVGENTFTIGKHYKKVVFRRVG